jgi:hypothetical protein
MCFITLPLPTLKLARRAGDTNNGAPPEILPKKMQIMHCLKIPLFGRTTSVISLQCPSIAAAGCGRRYEWLAAPFERQLMQWQSPGGIFLQDGSFSAGSPMD